MGKHKEKSKKHKKEKKTKSKKQKRSHSSSSEEEVWVEKQADSSSSSDDKYTRTSKKSYSKNQEYSSDEDNDTTLLSDMEARHKKMKHEAEESESRGKRDDWMSLSTSFLSTSNVDRKREREDAKKLQREKEQYDPKQCPRELNPYWKDGGDGLPKFKKPTADNGNVDNYYGKNGRYNSRASNWRKKDASKINRSDTTTEITSTSAPPETFVPQTNSNSVNSEDVVSEKELNLMAAKLVKAEIMGNTKLVNELKEKLDKARNSLSISKSSTMQEDVLLTHTDAQGRSQPVKLQSDYGESSSQYKKKKSVDTHKDGQRVRYFADDDKYSLKQMFEKEKYNSVEDQNIEFAKMAGKIRKNDDLDEVFADNIRKKMSESKIDSKNRDRAVNEHQKISKSLDNCNRCIQSEAMSKHLMITMTETSYLALPSHEPLTEGHCLIVPIRHVPCSTQLDENEWSDIIDIRKALVKLFMSKNEDVIFFETATSLHRFPHMHIECIPLPKEDGDMAPIYFKKAIDESESEWAHNKKLVSLKGRDVRKAIPKGLPYFSVSFGLEEGYAHVIEDEQLFPNNFAQEIIGGMLDVHHSKWRKPKRESFDEQSKRVLSFSKEWASFDPKQ